MTRKKADTKADPSVPRMHLATPEHGRGKLRRSGPSPGSGRRPSAVKAIALNGVDNALPVIESLAVGGGPDAVPAFNALVKVAGLDGRISPADIRERLAAQVELIRSRPTWDAKDLVAHLSDVWR